MLVLVCALVAGASMPFAPSLSYDAWGWLLWGREIVGSLPFTTATYPSWKPLTGLIAIPLAPLGDAAPWLWVLGVRTAAVVAVVLAFRLGRRAAGPWAGVVAAAALLLVPGWLFEAGVGESEPLLTALLLGALDRHLARRDGAGLGLVFLASLLRPETWPLLAASGVVAWRRRPGLRPWVGAALVAVPVLWFGGDYVGSGSPFTGGHLARISRQAVEIQQGGSYPPLVVVRRGAELVPAVLLAGVPVALAAAVRRRDPLLLTLCAGALIWTAEVAAMSALGYPGIQRFLFPAAAAAVIAGASGLMMLVRLPRAHVTRAALAGVALVAVAASAFTAGPATRSETARIEHRADVSQSLVTLMERVNPRAFEGTRHVAVEGIETTALAWRLGVSPLRFRGAHVPGLALEVRDVPWLRMRRRVARHHLEVRQVLRTTELSLVSVTR
jgi:hypothetical protein